MYSYRSCIIRRDDEGPNTGKWAIYDSGNTASGLRPRSSVRAITEPSVKRCAPLTGIPDLLDAHRPRAVRAGCGHRRRLPGLRVRQVGVRPAADGTHRRDGSDHHGGADVRGRRNRTHSPSAYRLSLWPPPLVPHVSVRIEQLTAGVHDEFTTSRPEPENWL
jgi:hypothetical protein